MFHDFVEWLQYELGKSGPDGQSWSNQLWESLNIWNVIEGTHVLTIMFFAGTIWIIDLKMMGLAFKTVPFSRLNDRVLPITIISMAAMIVTGILVFFGRDPLLYYHNIWFRAKMVFLLIAVINIFWFHYRVQKDQAMWDGMESMPAKVKLSGAISMTSWVLIIILGRLIAYDWFLCEKVEKGSAIYALQECKSALSYLDEAPEEEAAPEETPAEDAAPPPDTPPDTPPAEPAAPAEGAAPVQPVPGNGG